MGRKRRALVAVALAGWLCALGSHVAAARAEDEEQSSSWALTRDRFLLVSSLSMNTAVLSTVYRYAQRLAVGRR